MRCKSQTSSWTSNSICFWRTSPYDAASQVSASGKTGLARLWWVNLILFLVLAAPVRAQQGIYLSDLNLAAELLPPPPEKDSPEEAADFAQVVAANRARTQAIVAQALSEDVFFIFSYTPAVGAFFQPNRFPRTEALFRRVDTDTCLCIDLAKAAFKRPRPYETDPNLFHPLIDKPGTSYPSGHATRGTVFALLLADLFPDHREGILRIGRQLGWHRVIIGMHHPLDIYAGQVLGHGIVRQMKTNRAFRADFDRAKEEIAVFLRDHNPQLAPAAVSK